MDIPDKILDWPVDFSGDYDYGIYTTCHFSWTTEHPDKRCLTGIRVQRHWCDYDLGLWENIRELADFVGRHIATDHLEAS